MQVFQGWTSHDFDDRSDAEPHDFNATQISWFTVPPKQSTMSCLQMYAMPLLEYKYLAEKL